MVYVREPVAPSLASRAAAKFFEINHCRADRAGRARCRRLIPPVLVGVGELRALVYAADRGGKGVKRSYIHFMDRPPILACNVAGDQLFIIGGSYRITPRGIEG